MATITKTSSSGNWKFTVTGNNIIATGSTFNFTSPTITATYRFRSGFDHSYGAAIAILRSLYFGSTEATSTSGEIRYSTDSDYNRPPNRYTRWVDSSTKTLIKSNSGLPHNRLYNTATFFNSSNRTKKTLDIHASTILYWYLSDSTAGMNESQDSISFHEVFATITLDAPPILDSATVTTNTQTYFWKDITTASVALSSSWIQYGGTISSATFTIGDQTVTGSSGTLSIIPNTVGTFTPTLTVTDSRGQTTTKTFDSITVQEYSQPTADWGTVNSSTTGFWANKSTASINVTNFTQSQGFKPTYAQFIIGQQIQATELTGNETSIPLSIRLNTVGTFTPQVKITTNAGVMKTYSYSPITVQEYAPPSIEFTADRATSNGIISDDDTNILVKSIINYKEGCGGLLQPITTVTDKDSNTANAVITWYEAWNENSGVSSPIDWTNYNPSSPKTIYGLVTGYGNTSGFNTNYSFQISITPIDAIDSGTAIIQLISSAFYTIDIFAGGHGITFGKPASKEGFESNMDSTFYQGIMLKNDPVFTNSGTNAVTVNTNDVDLLTVDWDGKITSSEIISCKGISALPVGDNNGYHRYFYGELTYDAATLKTNDNADGWIVGAIKAICQRYPNKEFCFFEGLLRIGSYGHIWVFIYNTSDLSNGLPRYCFGNWRGWANYFRKIWTNEFVYYEEVI